MAQLNILYWRDIPSQIVVKQGRTNAKVMLPARFQEAIDMAAMRDKAHDSDAYLDGWRKGEAEAVDGELEAAAADCAARIEAEFDEATLRAFVVNGGRKAV